jgi:hypothetical protein
MPLDDSLEGRAERRRADRLRAGRNRAKRAGRAPKATGGPAVIPSEARMMRNIEREWGDALPGGMGRIYDHGAKSDIDPADVEDPRDPA